MKCLSEAAALPRCRRTSASTRSRSAPPRDPFIRTSVGARRPYTEHVSSERARARSILHIDLDPFFVSVERSLDASLRGRPLIVGGHEDGSGVVAAASDEARANGVRAGQPIRTARRLCPEAVVRPGDLDTYARVSGDVTSLLLSASRRVERPSADEAYVDLTREAPSSPTPVAVAESLKD